MTKIPKLKTEKEEAHFWDTHDSVQFLNEFKEESKATFPRPKHKSIVIDLEEDYLETIKEIAQKKHLPYHSLIRHWLKEKISSQLI